MVWSTKIHFRTRALARNAARQLHAPRIASMVTAPEASDAAAAAAAASTAAAAAAVSPAADVKPPSPAADSRKRTRSASQADEATLATIQSATAAAAIEAAAAGASAEDDAFTEDENEAAMSEVMKEVAGSTAAFPVASAPTESAEAAKDGTVVEAGAAVEPGAEVEAAAVAAPGRVQLYESKRMSRVSFSSWFEFDSYFEMYMQDTFQPFRMRSSCSVEAYRRNQQKVMMNNKNSRGRRIEFPDEAIHHHRIYMCTHAMKARCRGATTRPGQKYRGIGCIAKINVKISPSENPSKYMVIVTDQVVTHNHPISREIYEAYPDVVMKNMRRNQMGASLLTRQPAPKFETPAQAQKYERASAVLASMAEMMARLGDEDFEAQLATLQKLYGTSATSRTV